MAEWAVMPRRFLLVTCARCLLLEPVLDTGTTGSICPRCGDRDVEAIPLTPPTRVVRPLRILRAGVPVSRAQIAADARDLVGA